MRSWELKYHWYSYSDKLRYFTKTARTLYSCERCGGRVPRQRDDICWQCRQWECSDEGQQWLKVEIEKLEERYNNAPMYSVCKANGKFFWLAIPTHERYWSALLDGTTKDRWRSGYADTHEAALAAAILAYPGGVEDRPYGAIHYHRQLAARRHFNRMKAKPSHTRQGVMVDYLWYGGWYWDGDYEWRQARIIRKTAKRVFVAKRRRLESDIFNPVEYEEHPEWFHTYALDREKLERTGSARGGSRYHCEIFYTGEGKRNQEAERVRWHSSPAQMPECLSVFGLKPGCSEMDVKRAYRRKSRKVHPDCGGSHEAFIELRDHFDMAMRYARSQL
jgi:hypothetical protein